MFNRLFPFFCAIVRSQNPQTVRSTDRKTHTQCVGQNFLANSIFPVKKSVLFFFFLRRRVLSEEEIIVKIVNEKLKESICERTQLGCQLLNFAILMCQKMKKRDTFTQKFSFIELVFFCCCQSSCSIHLAVYTVYYTL